jgi:hypothetical protein
MPGVRYWIISLVGVVVFFIISIAVSFKDRAQQKDGRWERGDGSKKQSQVSGYRVQQQDGPSATTPEDRRWEMGAITVGNRK